MNSSLPHGEERRAATRLEPWAKHASGTTSAALVLRDALANASAPQDEGGVGAWILSLPQSLPHGEERREATRLEPWATGASGATRAALVLRDALADASAPQDEGGVGA